MASRNGGATVSCGSTAAVSAGAVADHESELLLDPYDSSENVHDFIINVLSAWSICTVVTQGFHNDSL